MVFDLVFVNLYGRGEGAALGAGDIASASTDGWEGKEGGGGPGHDLRVEVLATFGVRASFRHRLADFALGADDDDGYRRVAQTVSGGARVQYRARAKLTAGEWGT